jgi:hypothetical protein
MVEAGPAQRADYNGINCSHWYLYAAVQHNP